MMQKSTVIVEVFRSSIKESKTNGNFEIYDILLRLRKVYFDPFPSIISDASPSSG